MLPKNINIKSTNFHVERLTCAYDKSKETPRDIELDLNLAHLTLKPKFIRSWMVVFVGYKPLIS